MIPQKLKELKAKHDVLDVELDELRLKRNTPGYDYTREIEIVQEQINILREALELDE